MKSFFVIFLFLLANLLLGQSWDAQIAAESVDSLKVDLFKQASESYRGKDYDSAFYYAYQGRSLAEKSGYENGVFAISSTIGNFHFFQSNYDSALYYYNQAYFFAIARQDSSRIGALLNNIGTVYNYQAKYDTALVLLFKAREIRDATGDPKISSTLNNLGIVYQKQGQLSKALEFFIKAATLKEEQGTRLSLSNTYNNIGIILKNQGSYDSAILYYDRSLKIAEEYGDKNKEANAHNNLAILYEYFPDLHQRAVYHYRQSIALKKAIGDKVGLANSYFNYAELLNLQGKPNEALAQIRLAESLDLGAETVMHSYSWLLAKAHSLRLLKRYEEAMDLQREALDIRYEEISKEKNDRIAELEVAYETTQKEAEIERLSIEKAYQESELKSTRMFLIVSFASSLLIFVLILMAYYLRAKKQRAEREAQQLQIEALQKRLMDLNASPREMHLELGELNIQLHNELSEREYEVLSLSMEGKSNQEIAEQLFVSNSTVKFHLRNVYAKLGVTNRKEAVAYVSKA